MKKIITLVTMFVLSAGCLMAQGVFTYQAVVYDGTSLVVDQDVTATVTITDGTHAPYTQTLTGIHTSPNGLAVLPIGPEDALDDNAAFFDIDWSKAKITVKFAVDNTEVTVANAEQIPAVPYALQSNNALTTQMVADYISHAKMQDVLDILEATENNKVDGVSLHDAVLAALVDSVKNNYPLAKEILLSYISQADANDVDQLYNAFMANENWKNILNAIANIVDANLETPEGKAMIYEVLVAYASQLTDNDVQAILNAITPAARNEAIKKALLYYLGLQVNYNDEDIQAAMEDLAKYYIEHINTTQVNNLIYTIEHNQHGAMPVLQAQFNAWMAAYVQKVLNEYYYCPGGAPDLCAVWDELKNASTDPCLNVNSTTFTFEYVGGDEPYYKGTLNCTHGSDFTEYNLAESSVFIDNVELSDFLISEAANGNVEVFIYPGSFSSTPSSFTADVHLEVLCNNSENPEPTYDFTGTYTQGGGSITPSVCLGLTGYVAGECFTAQVTVDGNYYTLSIPYTDGTPTLDDPVTVNVVSLNGHTFDQSDRPSFSDAYDVEVNTTNSTIDVSFAGSAFYEAFQALGQEIGAVTSFHVEFNVYDNLCGQTYTVHVCYGL